MMIRIITTIIAVGILRFIFRSKDERHDDNDEHNVRDRVPVHENPPMNKTTPNFPRVGRSDPFQSSSKPPQSSSTPSPSSSKSATSSSKPPPDYSPTYSKAPQSSPSLAPSSSNPPPSSSSSHKPFRHNGSPSSSGPPPTSPSQTPEDIKGLIRKDIVPEVLKQPLSPSTYKNYFAALLYAEDFYLEKWNNFQLKNVVLKLHEAEINQRPNMLVVFEFDSIPEKLPFLLSRDLVYAQPSGKKVRPFQGSIYRVVKSTHVLVEFGEHFHSQHCSTSKYDISFSLNKVCLKRAHQAIKATSNALLQNFLFPECISRKNILNLPFHFPANQEFDADEFAAINHILSFRGSPPYLVGGSRCTVTRADNTSLSRTGLVVQDAVFQAYKISSEHRILVCAPTNSTCDVLNKSLKKMISEADMFRANAAFREIDGVPIDILSSCPIEGECFACPSLQQLLKFKIILTTFVSSFRLHNEGIAAGHFTHIFLMDASTSMEPEVMIALANFVDDNTTVIVTGAPRDHSGWVRSDMGRKYGLRKSYFERLLELKPYRSSNSMFITKLDAFDQ